MLEMQTSYVTERGGRDRNEDACGYWTSEGCACWVVSDGAGGHGSGDIASRLVVSTILRSFAARPSVSPDMAANLLRQAHDTLIKEKSGSLTTDDMHATAVLLLIDPRGPWAVWGHAGDTRLYLFRRGQLLCQTRDHSLIQDMIDAGYGNAAMIRSHPQRSLLTSALGSADDLVLSVSSEPLSLKDGDVFLICTDGWWESVDEENMQDLLKKQPGGDAWLEGMRQLIVTRASDSTDNYTAVCVRINGSVADDETTVIIPA
jgi:serine/threonine protein phosphatase PrpC